MSIKPGLLTLPLQIATNESYWNPQPYCAFMSFQDIPQMQPLQMGTMYDHINLDSYN